MLIELSDDTLKLSEQAWERRELLGFDEDTYECLREFHNAIRDAIDIARAAEREAVIVDSFVNHRPDPHNDPAFVDGDGTCFSVTDSSADTFVDTDGAPYPDNGTDRDRNVLG